MDTITKTDRQAWADERFAVITTGRLVADLTGSPKQIAWAADIRARLISAMVEGHLGTCGWWYDDTDHAMPEKLVTALRILLRIRNADWWINQRDLGDDALYARGITLAAAQATK